MFLGTDPILSHHRGSTMFIGDSLWSEIYKMKWLLDTEVPGSNKFRGIEP